jgi:ferredoxin-type protein NapH
LIVIVCHTDSERGVSDSMAVYGNSPFQVIGIVYAIISIFIGAWLWHTGRFDKKVQFFFLFLTAFLGFLIFSPMLPVQFQDALVRIVSGTSPGAGAGAESGPAVTAVLLGVIFMIILAFIFSRHFCGYLCPIGALQELVYHVPLKKVMIRQKRILTVIRFIIFCGIIIMAFFFSTGLLSLFGITSFFSLALTAASLVFIALLVISAFIYRPFCRIICPTGLLFQIAAAPARLKIYRIETCIECGKCEKACPTDEAKRTDLKSECYLCHRCIDVCPVEGKALKYGIPPHNNQNAGIKESE